MWGPQLPALGDYRILVPDLPGFGASNHLAWHSTAETADALAAVLDGIAVDKTVLDGTVPAETALDGTALDGTVRDGTVLDETALDGTVRDNTPAHVVGLSLGSTVALQLAARHPHLVASLFLASAQVVPPRRRDRAHGGSRGLLGFGEHRDRLTGCRALRHPRQPHRDGSGTPPPVERRRLGTLQFRRAVLA
jgi:pimeloyl-ACP methyl ester carboxylesterase